MLYLSKFWSTCFITLSIICCSSGEYTFELFLCFLWKVPLDLTAHKTSPLEYGYSVKSNILFNSVYVSLIKFSYPTTSTGIFFTSSHSVICVFHSWDLLLTSLFQAGLFTTKIQQFLVNQPWIMLDPTVIASYGCTQKHTHAHMGLQKSTIWVQKLPIFHLCSIIT